MADYGSSTNLGYILTSVSDSVSANLKAYGLSSATVWANGLLNITTNLSSTPAIVGQACEYYAAGVILRILFDVSLEESSTVEWYFTEAERLMDLYMGSVADEDDLSHPYSSSKTPGYIYSGRNKRTTYDDNDYEYIDDTTWTTDD
jgi:hypothetical protein